MFQNKKVIMIMPERLGDTLMCTPAIHYLKHYYPSTEIIIIALSELAAETLKHNPDINQILILPSHKALINLVTDNTLVINIHDGPLAREYISQLNVPTKHIPENNPNIHQAEQALLFMQSILPEHPPIIERRYQLFPQKNDFDYIKNLLQEKNIHLQTDILIGCHLGCHSVAKRGYKIWRKPTHPKVWPFEYIKNLAEKLKAKEPRIRLVITGSNSEKALGKKLLKAQPQCVNLINQTSVTALAALMTYLKMFITPDTGVMHIACSTNTPLIALFGPTSLKRTGPYPDPSNLTLLQGKTMQQISVEQVYDTIIKLLA